MNVYFTSDLQKLGKNKVTIGAFHVYEGVIGTKYLLNRAFRRANWELKESVYAEANWSYEGEKTAENGAKLYYFAKRNKKGEFVVLEVADYRKVSEGN